MTTQRICENVANHWLRLTEKSFEDWLHETASKNPGSDYCLILSGYLAGNLSEDWARDYASPEVLCE